MSIKNKLVTAVTTAGLLAGLFGSAFVPAVKGAGRPAPVADPVTPKASLTVLTTGAAMDKETGVNNFGFLSADSDDADSGATVNIVVAINSAGNVDVETADLKATSSNDDVLVAWSYEDDGTADTCDDMDSGGNDGFSDEDIVEEVADLAAAGTYRLCVAAATDTTAATSTVAIYAAEAGTSADDGWVLLKTVTVTAIGPTDTMDLSITDGYKYVAEDNQALTDWLTIACYDENGTLINDGTGSISVGNDCGTVTEYASNEKRIDTTTIGFISDATNGADAVTGAKSAWDLDAGVCDNETDADITDAGQSYALAVQIGTVVSDEITITCTGTDAVITSIYASDTEGPQVYDDGTGDNGKLQIIAVLKDESGLPLGDGMADDQDFGALTVDGATAIETEFAEADLDTTDVDASEYSGGEMVVADFDDGFDFGRRGKFTYTVSIAEPDLGDTEEDALSVDLTYLATAADSVEISYTRNAAKTKATVTVDFGEDEAFERAVFYVENAAGVVKEYLRRADAEGVATFTFARRNKTFYVYADLDAGGAPTDIVSIKFR